MDRNKVQTKENTNCPPKFPKGNMWYCEMEMKACNQGKRKENKESSTEDFEILPFVGLLTEFWAKGLLHCICWALFYVIILLHSFRSSLP